MDHGRTAQALARARELVDAVQSDPERVGDEAQEMLDRGSLDTETEATAWWALGLAARQLNDLTKAETALSNGLNIAAAKHLSRLQGAILSSLSLVHLYQGHTTTALEEAERSTHRLSGVDLARTEMQIGLILQRLGRFGEALDRYRIALRGLRRGGDRLTQARLLINRGLLYGYRGQLELGIADLRASSDMATDLGQDLLVAICANNLGFLEGRRGDIPAALAWFDRAESTLDRLGRPPGMIEVVYADRARLLLDAGLISEAEQAVTSAFAGLENSDNKTDLSEVRLLAAEVALAADRLDDALTHAEMACSEFAEQMRPGWRLLAEYAGVRARFEARTTTVEDADSAGNLATRLAESGLVEESRHCRLLAGRIALDAGQVTEARRWLKLAAGARRTGTSIGRVQAWYAEALLRDAEGNSYGTWRAIEAGRRVIRNYRSTFGARDLRAHAAGHGLDLARLALDHALEIGSPWPVLEAVESWRAISRQVDSVRPEEDPELSHLLSELRRIDSEIRERAVAGERTDRAVREKARTERQIRAVSRRRRGDDTGIGVERLDRSEIETVLAGRRLISYFARNEAIGAVSIRDSHLELHEPAEVPDLTAHTTSLLNALTRLAVGAGTRKSLEATYSTMVAVRDALRDSLRLDPEDTTPLVVIPSGALHRLPWPYLTGVPTSVAPSLAAWLAAAERARPLGSRSNAALIAGPRLPAATREIDRLARIYANRTRLTGRNARARRVVEALDGSDVAHIAAHGDFRWDNPSFSALEMVDGPLTAYELEQLGSPPTTVVLSACDMAVSRVVAGDELLGLSSVLISVGVSSLVAPLVPIPDDLAGDLVVPFHRSVADESSPSVALALATAGFETGTPQQQALAASFVSIGA